ncbi:MAG: succinate dehydrogenase [Gammaproteobacteria bacterium]|nr:succinate dehydrogenase [Gammaproteobacteria bacterium]
MERRLFIAQRLTAMILALLVIIHLGLIMFAVRGGLTAAEILARTQGSIFWTIFYGLFVIVAAIHAPIGLRKVLQEWSGLEGSTINRVCWMFALLLLVLGFRAVAAVV